MKVTIGLASLLANGRRPELFKNSVLLTPAIRDTLPITAILLNSL